MQRSHAQAQQEIKALQAQHPDASVMLIAEKGTMGVGSSRMSGVNNVALWTGKQASPYIPFVNIAPIVCSTNDWSDVNEWNIWTCLFTCPKSHAITLDILEEPTPIVPFSAINITLASGCLFVKL